MTPERWRRVKEIFNRAVELDPQQQPAFLAATCGQDAALRQAVQDLLVGDAAGPSWFERPAVEAVPELLAREPETSRIGQCVGAHRIVAKLGQGGMGAVYLAERSDGAYQERVAIKIVKRGMDTDAILARFRRERQILANLDHPNIARLLNGGVTDDGLPFLVMEYIEGTPIDAYCDAHRLSVRQRVELFLGVCSAVQAAHRSLVIHRDLKPANILVTATGTPKLLDFGVAKLLAEPLGEAPLTAARSRWLTPDYASPEQIQGLPITTASDVYALGVVLYELLTGRSPYRFQTYSLTEVERVVCQETPLRPSMASAPDRSAALCAASPARLRRRLRGDLDTIVLEALRKEPGRRYGTVEQLAEDLRRHLMGLPVLARRDSLHYRAGKFLRRHWLAALAAGLLAASLLGGLVTTTWQAREARRQQRHAEQISEFMEELFRAPDPRRARGRSVLARELLDRAIPRMGREFQDLPKVKAKLLTTMGVSYFFLGEYESAETSLNEARQILQPTFADSTELAAALTWLGLLRYYQDRLDEAEELLNAGLDIRLRRLGPESREMAESLNHLGLVSRARGELAAAEDFHRRALTMRRQVLDPGDPEIAYSLNNLGMVLEARSVQRHGALAERRRDPLLRQAIGLLEEALALRQQAFGEDHPEVATSLENVAGAHVKLGDYEGAEPLYRQALEIRQAVLDPDHPDLALSYNNLGGLCYRQGKYPQAEQWFAQALEIYRVALGNEHKTVATVARNLASVVVRQKRYAEAETLFRQALGATRGAWGDDHPKVAEILEPLAQILSILGKEDEARQLRLEAKPQRAEGLEKLRSR